MVSVLATEMFGGSVCRDGLMDRNGTYTEKPAFRAEDSTGLLKQVSLFKLLFVYYRVLENSGQTTKTLKINRMDS